MGGPKVLFHQNIINSKVRSHAYLYSEEGVLLAAFSGGFPGLALGVNEIYLI